MYKDREQLEFAISQYVDGTLSPAEVAEIEAVLRSDAAAAELLREFREIDAAVKSPVAASFNWDRLANAISARIDDETGAPQSLPMPWVRFRTMAIAASVLIAAGIAFKLTTPAQPVNENVTTQGKPKPTMVALIKGPSAEKANAPAVAQVSIGPAPSLASAPNQYHPAEAILMQPSQVIIESDTPTERNAGLFQ
jgi:anti-sigma factor RsiW